MRGQFIPDDTDALRAWAGNLSSIASLAKARVDDLGNIASTVGRAGEGTAVNAIRSSLKKLQDRLTTASDHLSQGAGALTSLANTLDRLEEDAERKFKHYGSPKRFTPKWDEYELFGRPWEETNSAHHARSAAAKKLQQLAEQAPGAEHHEAAWQRFLNHVKNGAVDVYDGVKQETKDVYHVGKDVVTDLAGEVVGIVEAGWALGKLSYDLGPVNLLVHPAGWAASWENFVQTGEYVLTHKKQVAGALWDGLIDKDMWHKDKAAWAIVLAVNLLGPKGLGKVAGAMRGTEALTQGSRALERTGQGLDKLGAVSVKSSSVRDVVKLGRTFDIAKNEKFGNAHAIWMHVAESRSEELIPVEMKAQLKADPDRPYAGMFRTPEIAQDVGRRALVANAPGIAKWRDFGKSDWSPKFWVDLKPGEGWAMQQGTYSMGEEPMKAIMILKKDKSAPGGFYVLTLFPKFRP